MRAGPWLAAAAVAFSWAAAAPGDTSPDRVNRLIARLGSGAYADRERATRELDALGADGLAALGRAAQSPDPETRRRAAELIERIGDRLATARILAASTIEFKYENKPLRAAVDDFARRTGATISLSDPNKLRDRTITAATPGPIPFWDALELLCRKGDIHEVLAPSDAQQSNSGMVIQGRVMIRRGYRGVNLNPSAIVLRDGPGPALPVCRSGAVRIRIAPQGAGTEGVTPGGADEVILPFQISAEPKLHWQGAVDMRIDRAVDDRGCSLACTPAKRDRSGENRQVVFINGMNGVMMTSDGQQSPIGVRVPRGEKPGTRLAELSGSVAAQVRVTEPLAVADSPLKAAGETVRGNFGVTLKIESAAKAENGDVSVSLEIQMPTEVQLEGNGGVQMAGQMRIMPGGIVRQMGQGLEPAHLPAGTTEFQGLAIEDAQGRRFAATRGMIEMSRFAPDGMTFKVKATFKPADASRQPHRLVFSATRPATIEIPFAFKDVPLQ